MGSMEYNCYVIASPANENKFTHYNRSYSFISLSSRESSSSELSNLIQTTKRAPKSREALQSVKEKLMKEIENINNEIAKMDAEKIVLKNTCSSALMYRSMICTVERNNQGIPQSDKLRNILERIEISVINESAALNGDFSTPHIEELRGVFEEFSKLCKFITENKVKLKIPAIEDLLFAVGKLYGCVDSILQIYYDHDDKILEEENSEVPEDPLNGSTRDFIMDQETSYEEHDDSKESLCSTAKSNISDYLGEVQDGSYTAVSETIGSRTLSGSSDEASNNMNNVLNDFSKKLLKTTKHFQAIERYSSGNPKHKSLRKTFTDILSTIGEDLQKLRGIENIHPKHKVIVRNSIELGNHLAAEKTGQRELEHIRIIVGEICGRIDIVLKSEV